MKTTLSSKQDTINVLSTGEVMKRIRPQNKRGLPEAFFLGDAYLGGAVANVSANLSTCYGYPNRNYSSSICVDLLTGLIKDGEFKDYLKLLRAVGISLVDCQTIKTDSVGSLQNVKYLLETADPLTGSQSVSYFYRKNGPFPAKIKPDDFNWEKIFTEKKYQLAYCDGLLVGLENIKSQGEPLAYLKRFINEAYKQKVPVAFDTNFRKSLSPNDPEMIITSKIYRSFLDKVTVLTGSFGHLLALLKDSQDYKKLSARAINDKTFIAEIFNQLTTEFPNIEVIGATIRDETTSPNIWKTALYFNKEVYCSKSYPYQVGSGDRPGMGDASTAQLLAGVLIEEIPPQLVVERMAACGIMIYNTLGDIGYFFTEEIDAVINSNGGGIER